MRNVIDHLIDRVSRIRLPNRRHPWGRLGPVFADVSGRFETLRWRLRTTRLGRSADGIIVVPLLGIVLVLGIFTATATTHRSSAVDSDLTLAAIGSDAVDGDVVTQTNMVTVTTPGKKKLVTVERTRVRRRVVKEPGGGVSTVLEPVAAPGPSETKTVAGPTKTVSVTGPTNTVTQVVTETVTSVLTVTETVRKKP